MRTREIIVWKGFSFRYSGRQFLFHSKSSDLVHVRESMIIESHIAGFMCISNNLLVIKSYFKLEGYCVFIPPKLFDKYHVLLSTSASLHVICKWIYPSPQMYQDKKETRLARNSSTLGWSITSTVGSSTRIWLLHKNWICKYCSQGLNIDTFDFNCSTVSNFGVLPTQFFILSPVFITGIKSKIWIRERRNWIYYS